jgi:hypothetical protein
MNCLLEGVSITAGVPQTEADDFAAMRRLDPRGPPAPHGVYCNPCKIMGQHPLSPWTDRRGINSRGLLSKGAFTKSENDEWLIPPAS